MKEDGGYEVREHRKDDAVSASTLPIGGSDIWKRGYLSLFLRPLILCIKNLYTMSEGSTIALEFSFVNLRSHNRNLTVLAFWIRKFLPQ